VRVVSFKAEEELIEALDRLARERKTSRSELIRRALILYINKEYSRRAYATTRIRVY